MTMTVLENVLELPKEEFSALAHAKGAALRGDLAKVREYVESSEGRRRRFANNLLMEVVKKGHLEVIQYLLDAGADVNCGQSEEFPEGALDKAVGEGQFDVVKLLLAHGAETVKTVRGMRRGALTTAAHQGNLEIARLLVEHGADVNATWMGDTNPLVMAYTYNQTAMVEYLKSVGAKLPEELVRLSPQPEPQGAFARHLSRTGKVGTKRIESTFHQEHPIIIHIVDIPDVGLAAVTEGLAATPLKTPRLFKKYAYPRIELAMLLPGTWRFGADDLYDPQSSWPLHWMRRLAARLRVEGKHLPAFSPVGDPPNPLCDGLPFTHLIPLPDVPLLPTYRDTESKGKKADAADVHIFQLLPVHAKEAAIVEKRSLGELLEKLEASGASTVFDPQRKSVAG